MDLEKMIRSVPDFPSKGVLYRDITPIVKDKDGLREAINQLKELVSDWDFDLICGPESRGFIFGTPLALELDKGFIMVRKAGKLPYEKVTKSYALEYGEATIEMHKDSIKPGQKVLIIDDLLATGGTCEAMIELIEELGGEVVGCVFLIELDSLKGREVLKSHEVRSLIHYED